MKAKPQILIVEDELIAAEDLQITLTNLGYEVSSMASSGRKAIKEMIRVGRPGCKIVIADESERVAQLVARLFRLSRSNQGRKVDTSVPVHLVPETMEQIREDGIWKRHGHYHGYCLEFRKPA